MKRLYSYPKLSGALPSATEVPAPVASVLDVLLPLLDGATRVENVVARLLARGLELAAVLGALEWLEGRGLLSEGEKAGQSLSEARLSRFSSQVLALAALGGQVPGMDFQPRAGVKAQEALARATVLIAGAGEVGLELSRLLALAGVGGLICAPVGAVASEERLARAKAELAAVDPDVRFLVARSLEDLSEPLADTPASLLVHCPDHFESSSAEALNALSLEAGIPLLLYRQDLGFVDLGPLVVPHETACYVCYRLRREAAADGPAWFPSLPPRLRFSPGLDLLALEVVKLLTGVREPSTRGRLVRLDLGTGRTDSHSVLRLPRCTACGTHHARPVRKLWEA